MSESYVIFVTIFSIVAALTCAILSVILITPAKKRERLPAFFRWLHDVFNFKALFLEKILKFTYIFATIWIIVFGFFSIFQEPLGGFLVMLLGPIAIRISYECFMLIILLVKNVIEINNRLSGEKKQDMFNPQMPNFNIPVNTYVSPANAETTVFCTKCGAKYNPAVGCTNCQNNQ